MPDVLLLSDNQGFTDDLAGQISLYTPEFSVYRQEGDNRNFDVYILDEKSPLAGKLRQEHHKAPILLLEKADSSTDF